MTKPTGWRNESAALGFMSRALGYSGLKPEEKLILLAINGASSIKHAGVREWDLGQEHLAKVTGFSPRAIRTALVNLKSIGAIVEVAANDRLARDNKRYMITQEWLFKLFEDTRTLDEPRKAKQVTTTKLDPCISFNADGDMLYTPIKWVVVDADPLEIPHAKRK